MATAEVASQIQTVVQGEGDEHVCRECGRVCKSHFQLAGHMNSHSKVQCHICNKAFYKASYKVHLKTDHPKKYKCSLCEAEGTPPFIDSNPRRVIKHILDHAKLDEAAKIVYQYLVEA